MKPLNLDNSPCSPISSNCVVWQGPDIPCIALCTGDTVSDVVSAMATELCTILETLKVSNYDLTCFNTNACAPADFQALIQFLIKKICELEGIPAPAAKATSDCPDCIVNVAECFVTGTQTTMQLVDYVQLIGQRVCSIITDISLINTQITDILVRLETLENTPAPTFTMPTFTLSCQIGTLLSGSTQAIDTLLEQFINNVWCGFYAVTGSTTELTTAVAANCITDASVSLAKSPSTMAAGYLGTWVPDASYNTVSDAINNLWISLCDIFTYLSSNPISVTVGDTNTIDLSINTDNVITARFADSGWVNLNGFTWVSGDAAAVGNMPQCRRIGNVIHFRGFAYIPMAVNPGVDNTVVNLTSTTAYNGLTTKQPATSGAGSVVLNAAGSLKWNQGNSVIPTSVLPAGSLDAPYRTQYPSILNRVITVSPGVGTMLTSAGRLGILSDGSLYFATLKDQEQPASLGTLFVGASPLRYITSNIRSGEYVPNYINPDTDIHNLPAAGASNLVGESGFPNAAGTDDQWPFSLDAGEEDEIGGFYATLDGLTAFVACDATAATATCYTT